ncbi:telomere zinc finger-associated protein [Astyanax mexicanus]|uniref:telomere zinc finger-associated protein n=1 Tax=Astyanax mexicanus TaxID=7994 RepID=UPI0020CAA100|nr:telomere zinc finger-associated protein [Astyanax mexicanus]XP_022532817.2 telomere zinc finger-associated protein [Astyanax mexicanus]XP_049318649.1 telomere zinc finger-associated protein [Astyanax mexicanus]
MELTVNGSTHTQWVLSQLNQQRQLGKFCDVMLSTPNGQVFLAHRNVLACFSQLFHDSISITSTTTTTNTSAATPCMEVSLPPECTEDGLELLLSFFYTGDLQLNAENEEKVRGAASGLSVPDSLIPGGGAPGVKAPEGPWRVCSGDADAEDTKLDLSSSGHSKSRQRVKNKVETPGISEPDDFPSIISTTTTRSGRKVKGPSRLVGQSLTPGLQKTVHRRRVPAPEEKAEDAVSVTTEENQSSSQISNEVEEAPGVRQNDDPEEDADDGLDIFPEDTDEEYVPHDSPDTPVNTQRVKTPRKGRATNKENGEEQWKGVKKGSVQCPTCHKTFLSKYYLKVHNRRHTGEKPFSCSKCGKCYYRKENLQEHEARNCLSRIDTVFSCTVCSMTFKKRQELRLHMVSHTGEMPNKCTSCPEQFMQKKDLRTHMIKIHGAPKPHACPLCPKCFLSRTELRLHEASKHRGEKLFVCEECGHRASSRNGLQMHIKAIHRNERPFVCEFCNHAFSQKANLNMHLRTHTGEKPFQCHLCGKTFRTQASLDKHHRTHTGERPYSCEFCEQRFTEKGPLLRHIASKHQEGRPHVCQICNKSFKAVEQLRVHVRRHEGMRKFECRECGYKFTRQAHLRRHMQIHNRVENYNPRQRRLRNLVINDETTPVEPIDFTESTESKKEAVAAVQDGAAAGDTELQPEALVLTQGEASLQEPTGPEGDQGVVTDTETAESSAEQPDFREMKHEETVDEQDRFTVEDVIEHTVLVSDAFPIQSDLEVELQGTGSDGKT